MLALAEATGDQQVRELFSESRDVASVAGVEDLFRSHRCVWYADAPENAVAGLQGGSCDVVRGRMWHR